MSENSYEGKKGNHGRGNRREPLSSGKLVVVGKVAEWYMKKKKKDGRKKEWKKDQIRKGCYQGSNSETSETLSEADNT